VIVAWSLPADLPWTYEIEREMPSAVVLITAGARAPGETEPLRVIDRPPSAGPVRYLLRAWLQDGSGTARSGLERLDRAEPARVRPRDGRGRSARSQVPGTAAASPARPAGRRGTPGGQSGQGFAAARRRLGSSTPPAGASRPSPLAATQARSSGPAGTTAAAGADRRLPLRWESAGGARPRNRGSSL